MLISDAGSFDLVHVHVCFDDQTPQELDEVLAELHPSAGDSALPGFRSLVKGKEQ